MKKLYLLRHASAQNSSKTGTDFDRELSQKGIDEARALGEKLIEKGYAPSFVLCSPALRTRQTLKGALGDEIYDLAQFSQNLYNENADCLLNEAKNVNDKFESLLIISHNPGIHILANAMAAANGAPIYDFMPATFCAYECDIESWADLSPEISRLIDILSF